MDNIEIRDIQNVAQNMFVGSKQHALFRPVVGNNPNLLSSGNTPCGYDAVEEPDTKVEISKDTPEQSSFVSVSVSKVPEMSQSPRMRTPRPDDIVGGLDSIRSKRSLNSHLYGMLKPCPRQFYNA